MLTTEQGLHVDVKEIPAQTFLGRRFMSLVEGVGTGVQGAMAQLYARIASEQATPTGPPFLVASPPSGGMMAIEVGAPCSPVPTPGPGQFRGRLAACRAAVTVYRGPYDQIAPTYSGLFAWVEEHGYKPAGDPREIYLNGPADVESPEQYLTEVVLPIT